MGGRRKGPPDRRMCGQGILTAHDLRLRQMCWAGARWVGSPGWSSAEKGWIKNLVRVRHAQGTRRTDRSTDAGSTELSVGAGPAAIAAIGGGASPVRLRWMSHQVNRPPNAATGPVRPSPRVLDQDPGRRAYHRRSAPVSGCTSRCAGAPRRRRRWSRPRPVPCRRPVARHSSGRCRRDHPAHRSARAPWSLCWGCRRRS